MTKNISLCESERAKTAFILFHTLSTAGQNNQNHTEYEDDSSSETSTHNSRRVTASKLIIFSLSLLALLHFSTKLYINILNGSTIGAIFTFYTAVFIGIALPLESTKWIRLACGTVGHRALELVNPRCSCLGGSSSTVPRAVPFIDVFFADAMCSVSLKKRMYRPLRKMCRVLLNKSSSQIQIGSIVYCSPAKQSIL